MQPLPPGQQHWSDENRDARNRTLSRIRRGLLEQTMCLAVSRGNHSGSLAHTGSQRRKTGGQAEYSAGASRFPGALIREGLHCEEIAALTNDDEVRLRRTTKATSDGRSP